MKITVKNIASSVLLLVIMAVPQVAFGQWDMGQNQSAATAFGVSTSTPTDILTNIINYALAIIGFLGVLGFIISGIMYLVSAGDEAMAEKAKNNMVYAIIGVIVALLGYVVMAAISTLLSAGGANNGL
ncbi:MAG: hypothetical protein PHT88_03295 [Candidatus Moranbacteria bacterium]|nr:hypothetical protein [Candidatus Moranbacteria bacterium]